MLSIFIIFFLLIVSFIFLRTSKRRSIRHVVLLLFNLLVVEVLVYGYFLYVIYQANCFFLIGNQKVLDVLIKARLVYATYFAQGKESFMFQVDNVHGYTLGRSKQAMGMYKTNAQGFRANREYSLRPESQTLRMAAFGDSFVFCDGEKNVDTWPYFLEQSVENLEVLNFGVSGYGFAQSYLRYLHQGLSYHPDIVFFNYIYYHEDGRDSFNPVDILKNSDLRLAHFYRVNFWLEDDILKSRSVTPFDLFDSNFRKKYFYQAVGLSGEPPVLSSKIFSFFNTGLLIKQTLLKKHFLEYLSDYQGPPSKKERQIKINVVMLHNLLETVKKHDSNVLFFYNGPYSKVPMEIKYVLEQYRDRFVYVDKTQSLKEVWKKNDVQRKELLNSSFHYNARGNMLYAEAVLEVLKKHFWLTSRGKFQYNDTLNSFELVH